MKWIVGATARPVLNISELDGLSLAHKHLSL